ncbi:putative transcriptional regulator, TetR [Actinoplanes sp. NBRC 14428]|uniref:TetR family transcriptional regulator n=1 Tax=Pseudosporangium ferrugineum TaxID=439699 RepID=A0A2T0SBC0_9ACTN|nr:TetR/AcrR family transcriptional regulator [Pseudosporangium ferrugineum]PRY30725.1 TetR family transcriptional regulator [Pseudosporangium ferrugineum]BCJ50278.1 putative transcriptional regulator, TetR [Actinoplanes sp. NBRC 14428]
MPRLVHDTSAILDAAVRLLVAGSADAITIAGVIREAGVSSGSVYHRFPTRAALLAAVWNRAVEGFHAELEEHFAGEPVAAAAALGRHTVAWCRAHPADARVLLAGLGAFEPTSWSPESRERREAGQARWDRHVRRLLAGLRAETGRETAELLLVVIDVPYAAVRRYLSAGRDIPANLGDIVERLIRAQLA